MTAITDRRLFDVADADTLAMIVRGVGWMAEQCGMPTTERKALTSAIFDTPVPADADEHVLVAAARRVLREYVAASSEWAERDIIRFLDWPLDDEP